MLKYQATGRFSAEQAHLGKLLIFCTQKLN
jgi:hypothetical protein